eukprot:409793-Alexandrium_andersonii.AAC.1
MVRGLGGPQCTEKQAHSTTAARRRGRRAKCGAHRLGAGGASAAHRKAHGGNAGWAKRREGGAGATSIGCLLYTSPSPRD